MSYFKRGLAAIVLIGLTSCGDKPPTQVASPGKVEVKSEAIASPNPSPSASSNVDNQPLFVDIPQEFEIKPDKPLILSPRLVRGMTLAFDVSKKGVLFTIKDSKGAIVKGTEGEISDKQGAAVFDVKESGVYTIELTVNQPRKVTISLKKV